MLIGQHPIFTNLFTKLQLLSLRSNKKIENEDLWRICSCIKGVFDKPSAEPNLFGLCQVEKIYRDKTGTTRAIPEKDSSNRIGYDFGQIADCCLRRAASKSFFAKRACSDDGLGTGRFELRRYRASDLQLLTVRNGGIGHR